MNPLVKVHQMSYSIPDGRTILDNISLEVHEGQFIGILGRNGVGKSTLLDLLLGNRPLTSGEIRVLDENPLNVDRLNQGHISFLSQDNNLKGNISIKQFLKFYSTMYENYSGQEEALLLKTFSLNSDVKIGSLSTGQQKKVQIVAALSALPKVLLIDEITAVLDPETRNFFFLAIGRHIKLRKMSVVLATNIAEDLILRADEVLFIDNGKAVVKKPAEITNLFNIEKAS